MSATTAIACGSPDAHLNPAVTLGFAVSTGDFSKLPIYLPAQVLGAMCGALLVWLHFLPHWAVTSDRDAKLACFSTSPAIAHFPSNFFGEAVGTFVLIAVASVAAAGLVWRIVPRDVKSAPAGLKALGSVLVEPRLLVALSFIVFFIGWQLNQYRKQQGV